MNAVGKVLGATFGIVPRSHDPEKRVGELAANAIGLAVAFAATAGVILYCQRRFNRVVGMLVEPGAGVPLVAFCAIDVAVTNDSISPRVNRFDPPGLQGFIRGMTIGAAFFHAYFADDWIMRLLPFLLPSFPIANSIKHRNHWY